MCHSPLKGHMWTTAFFLQDRVEYWLTGWQCKIFYYLDLHQVTLAWAREFNITLETVNILEIKKKCHSFLSTPETLVKIDSSKSGNWLLVRWPSTYFLNETQAVIILVICAHWDDIHLILMTLLRLYQKEQNKIKGLHPIRPEPDKLSDPCANSLW